MAMKGARIAAGLAACCGEGWKRGRREEGVDGRMDLENRLQGLDWKAIEQGLWEMGYAKTPPVLAPDECDELISLYTDQARFRRRIDMAQHRFGVGEYQYFAEPLPALVQA